MKTEEEDVDFLEQDCESIVEESSETKIARNSWNKTPRRELKRLEVVMENLEKEICNNEVSHAGRRH